MPIFQKAQDKQDKQENIINRVVEIPIAKIAPNPAQPRVIFDDYELSQLAVSIQQNGILQPITVRKSGEDSYEIISGERRLRASKLINLEYVPCIIVDTSTESSAVLAILENIQRSDLNYIEEAIAIRSLIEHFGITQENAAMKLGVAQSTIANKLRLLRLTDDEKALVLRYRLNERQARSLLKLPAERRAEAIEKISAANLNTAQTERFVDEMLVIKEKPPRRAPRSWGGKQLSLYINNINHTIDAMRDAGIECEAVQNRTDTHIELVVKIPIS